MSILIAMHYARHHSYHSMDHLKYLFSLPRSLFSCMSLSVDDQENMLPISSSTTQQQCFYQSATRIKVTYLKRYFKWPID